MIARLPRPQVPSAAPRRPAGPMLFACASNAQASGASPAHDEIFFISSDIDLSSSDVVVDDFISGSPSSKNLGQPPTWLCVATKTAATAFIGGDESPSQGLLDSSESGNRGRGFVVRRLVELSPEAEDTIQISLNNEATLLAVLGENFLIACRLGRDSAHRVVVERSITLCVGSNRPMRTCAWHPLADNVLVSLSDECLTVYYFWNGAIAAGLWLDGTFDEEDTQRFHSPLHEDNRHNEDASSLYPPPHVGIDDANMFYMDRIFLPAETSLASPVERSRPCHKAVDFCFGDDEAVSTSLWSAFAIYVMFASGHVVFACPVVPRGVFLEKSTLERLSRSLNQANGDLNEKMPEDFVWEVIDGRAQRVCKVAGTCWAEVPREDDDELHDGATELVSRGFLCQALGAKYNGTDCDVPEQNPTNTRYLWAHLSPGDNDQAEEDNLMPDGFGQHRSRSVLATSIVVLRSGATKRMLSDRSDLLPAHASRASNWPVTLLLRGWSNGNVDLNIAQQPVPVSAGFKEKAGNGNFNMREHDSSFTSMEDYSIVGEDGLRDKNPYDHLPAFQMVCHESVHVFILSQKESNIRSSGNDVVSPSLGLILDGIEDFAVYAVSAAEAHRIELDRTRLNALCASICGVPPSPSNPKNANSSDYDSLCILSGTCIHFTDVTRSARQGQSVAGEMASLDGFALRTLRPGDHRIRLLCRDGRILQVDVELVSSLPSLPAPVTASGEKAEGAQPNQIYYEVVDENDSTSQHRESIEAMFEVASRQLRQPLTGPGTEFSCEEDAAEHIINFSMELVSRRIAPWREVMAQVNDRRAKWVIMEEMIEKQMKLLLARTNAITEKLQETQAVANAVRKRHKELSHRVRVLLDAVFQLSRVIRPAEREWFEELRESSVRIARMARKFGYLQIAVENNLNKLQRETTVAGEGAKTSRKGGESSRQRRARSLRAAWGGRR